MADRLADYRRKRDAHRTPEPVPERTPRRQPHDDEQGRFVIQQHHARSLHWDLRLERGGVLVCWAVPRGLPREPGRNHLAVHTEDHPLEYLDFHGEIPAGEYGGGRMTIHDRGTYRSEKWRDDEVVIHLRGERTTGRYVLFATGGRDRDWMVRRTDPAPAGWVSMPQRIAPMRPTPARALPDDEAAWGYEPRWDGVRAIAYVSGGRLRLLAPQDHGHDRDRDRKRDRDGERDVTADYPWLRAMAEALAPTEAVLDGILTDIDPAGRVRPPRPGDRGDPAGQYLVVDLLWLDGVASTAVPYARRRELLDGLDLGGPHWQTTPWFPGAGAETLTAARGQGLSGILAKRLDAAYEPGRRSRDWLSIDVDRVNAPRSAR